MCLCAGHLALELTRQRRKRSRQLLRSGTVGALVVEELAELAAHRLRHVRDAGKAERAARALQLVREEQQRRESALERPALRQPAAVLAHAVDRLADVGEVVALKDGQLHL